MSEKYIRENKNSFVITKNSKSFGKFKDLDDAIFIRDELVRNDWDLNAIEEVYKVGDTFKVFAPIDEKIHLVAKFKKEPPEEAIQILIKNKRRNPNNSRYGLNITRVFDTFVIKKRIAGDDYIFGCYDNLGDAEFVRNHLLDNMWNVNSFSQIQYDEDTDTYKVVEVIDDRVYVLGTFEDGNIDLNRVHEDFLSKISKHKLGLALHPHLYELTGKIPELEERFNVKTRDETWSFDDTNDPLNDIVFNLTPFQKAVYDAVGDSTFEDIEKELRRFQSKNFSDKIQKNLDDLIERNLIKKEGKIFKKK